jgi:hypothetical protein
MTTTANTISYSVIGVDEHQGFLIVHYSTIQGPGIIKMVEILPTSSNTIPSGQDFTNMVMNAAPVLELVGIESIYANTVTRTAQLANADYTFVKTLLPQPPTANTQ